MRSLILALFFAAGSMFAQQSSRQDSSLFDFWVGEWDLTWKDSDGRTASGTNIITKILDGTVIHENFTGLTGQSKGYKGNSVSIRDNRIGVWKQTWVDNSGAYLAFTGGSVGTERYFEHEFMKEGVLQKGKMVFRNITRDAFLWDWMKSTDGGATWKTEWSITYKRKR